MEAENGVKKKKAYKKGKQQYGIYSKDKLDLPTLEGNIIA